MTDSRDHVRLLAIFHYVLAGLCALFALFPVLYIVMGLAIVNGAFPESGKQGPPEPFGWIFVAMGGFMLVLVAGFATLVVVAGRFLQTQRHWTFCVVVAALSCAFFPLGTALGVFTIIVLSKDEVKAAFAGRPPAAPLPTTPA